MKRLQKVRAPESTQKSKGIYFDLQVEIDASLMYSITSRFNELIFDNLRISAGFKS